VDTAGLRTTEDAIEQAGVDLARAALREVDTVLFVVDASLPMNEEDERIATELRDTAVPVIVARNKADIAFPLPHPAPEAFPETCLVSAVTGAGLGVLEAALGRALLGAAAVSETPMISRMHQADSLRRAAQCVDRALDCRDASPELLAFELREALAALGEITGETTPEDLLDIIFGQFCIGK
jgi:tRNA modification GTPase